ncbi:hypothetical protein Tco_0149899 [Tanacetum coccineum]
MSKVPDTEDTIKFMLDTKEFTYTVDMFRVTLHFLVETLENPFVTPVNIQTIEAFINRVGYQGVVDKVSAFYTKNLAQPWQTMFKVFNCCLTTRTSRHDQTKINIPQLFHAVINQTNVDYVALLWRDFMNNVFQKKEAIQYPRFIKLIIADLMKKFLNIPQRIDEDYHFIKDDIPLVSVYTTGNVLVRGMLILDEFLTEEIRVTDDFKEYETVFVGVDVPMNQPQPVVSTQGTHRSTPRAHRTPTVIKGEKDDDDSEDRLVLRSHKENPEHVDDDDDEEKVDEKKDAKMGSLETRTEEMQTPIPTPPRSPRKILSSDKNITQELTDIVSLPTATTSKTSHSKRCISRMLILDEFLTEEIRVTDDFKEYETVFVGVDVPMNQPQSIGKKKKQIVGESSSPRKSHKIAIRKKKQSTTLIPPPGDDRERDEVAEATILNEEEIEKMVEGDEDEESYASVFADSMNNDDVDDFDTRIEPGSHKEHPKIVNDDDEEIEKEKKDDEDKKTDEVVMEKDDDDVEKVYEGVKEKSNDDVATGSMEFRKEKMQTPIPSPTRSPRKFSSSDKIVFEELTATLSPTTATTSKDSSTSKRKKRSISYKTKILPGSIAGICRRHGQICSYIKNKFITHDFFMGKIREVLDHCNKVVPELKFAKTNEMINKKMPRLVNLAVTKDHEHTTLNLYPTTSSSTARKSTTDLQQQLYLNMKSKPQDQAADLELKEILKAKFEK